MLYLIDKRDSIFIFILSNDFFLFLDTKTINYIII